MWHKGKLDAADKKVYEQTADLLGPIGKPALDKLLEAAYDRGYNDGADDGWNSGALGSDS